MTKFSSCQILLPVSLTAFVLFGFLAFQASQILLERESLRQTRNQQNKPLEETKKVLDQFNALAIGTKKLAVEGDKNAIVIVNRLKQVGIGFTDPQSPASPADSSTSATTQPVPADSAHQ